MKTVSVVIPVKNEAAKIRQCIEGIKAQSVRPQEIVVLDSGSTDGTLEILDEIDNLKVIHVPSTEFNHGETRNLGVRATDSEFVALTVGDAIPVNEYWIQSLLDGFSDDEVVGVCGKQIVEASEAHNPADWYRPQSKLSNKRVQFSDPEEFGRLSPAEKRSLCGWDDVTAMYRRKALIEIPFQETNYSEDAIWAKDVLFQGKAIVYAPKAQVHHYHIPSIEFTYKRTLTVLYHAKLLFDYQAEVPSSSKALRAALRVIVRERSLTVIRRLYWARQNMSIHWAVRNAIRHFNCAVKQGDDAVERLHEKHCGTAPIPTKAS